MLNVDFSLYESSNSKLFEKNNDLSRITLNILTSNENGSLVSHIHSNTFSCSLLCVTVLMVWDISCFDLHFPDAK